MPLTELAIKHLKPKDKLYRVTDSNGLCLEVSPTGSKLWRYRFYHLGKAQMTALGKYPIVGLAQARKLRDEARAILETGKHPTTHKRAEKLRRAMEGQNTFKRMTRRLAFTTLLVREYDEAIAYYTQVLRFELQEDTRLSPTKRWVVVAPSRAGGALLLAQPANEEQAAMVGRQGAGRVWLFLHTDDFDGELAHFRAHGVHLTEEPRRETYGRVVVFEDLYGNRWDLIQPNYSTGEWQSG